VLLTTHKTLSNEYFEQIQKHRGTSLLIGDEAHHLGSEHQQSGLLVDYDYRVGLLLPPKRYFDEEGAPNIFSITSAASYMSIRLEKRFQIFSHRTSITQLSLELTAEELEEYRQLSHRLAKVAHNEDADDEIRERLAQKRANIIKVSRE